MSYLLDKKIKRKRLTYIGILIIILAGLFYFRLGIWNGLAYVSHSIFRPVIVAGNNLGKKFSNLATIFRSKDSIIKENQNLKSELNQSKFRAINYDSILAENTNLKDILGRKPEQETLLLASILGKSNQNLYDTLIIDVGLKDNIQEGDLVFALGSVPMGRVTSVYPDSTKVILFSSPGEETQGIINLGSPGTSEQDQKSIFVDLIGRGGGNFEITLPRDLTLKKGDQVVLPGISPFVLATVEAIISDPRDPFVKALLVSPVNVQELKFLQVKTSE